MAYSQGAYGGQPMAGGAPAGPFSQPVDPVIQQWFVSVDQDRSGQISTSELQQALTNSNWSRFNEETCHLMIGLFDRDMSGTINLGEFQALWTYIQQWKGVFDQFDRDRSGFIDANELNNAYTQMGYRLSPAFSSMVVFRYDPQFRRQLSLDNFIQSCVLLKTITDTFRQKDAQAQGVINVGYEEFLSMVMLNRH
ncbi:hypothetical protein CAPTEDRAFT_151788 [Capitella teleta]|uniref:EF-hand domain-containing protein n=1 Tax=Capitella teleta TaxID=283909 RepID=R7T6U2_CAPTE|nr:hypothetical protein CAPTEDRAFT_151788 [Capitella teleta]|eukprot:ELT89230.1 hypothetical protein CAPTEDRAFT_151788 [Capitella teleta]